MMRRAPRVDPDGIANKVLRGAYRTRRRILKAVARYHRAKHQRFMAIDVAAVREWLSSDAAAAKGDVA